MSVVVAHVTVVVVAVNVDDVAAAGAGRVRNSWGVQQRTCPVGWLVAGRRSGLQGYR